MVSIVRKIKDRFSSPGDYESAKRTLSEGTEKKRRGLASSPDTKPEILYFLASDESPDVRAALAANAASPAQADQLLADDPDEDVRQALAAKIAKLAPDLGPAESDKARALAYETLERLVRDQALRVREMLAEELKTNAAVAPEIVTRLASDEELTVAGPVLEYSPVLTDEILLTIIADAPSSGALSAISRRSEVRPAVSDAIVATDDEMAIADLLGNSNAQIREETLDQLAERAHDLDSWHLPLVRRPKLSSRAVNQLARYVARNMVDMLAARQDIDAETARQVTETLQKRIEEDDPDLKPRQKKQSEGLSDSELLTRVKTILKTTSAAEAVTSMVDQRETGLAVAAITILTGYDYAKVRKSFSQRVPKPIMALCWKAGLPASLAVRIQYRVAKISPSNVLQAGPGGDYPFTEDELNWQLEFFEAV